MPRKRLDRTEAHMRFPADLYAWMIEYAEKTYLSINDLTIQAVSEFRNSKENEEPPAQKRRRS